MCPHIFTGKNKSLTMVLDLKRIVNLYDIDLKFLAEKLFPKNTHKKAALNRILQGKSRLDSQQIATLASLIGVPIDVLYDRQSWSTSSVSKGVLHFSLGDYTAKLNRFTWTTTILKNGEPVVEEIMHPDYMTLSDYFSILDNHLNKLN